MSLPMGKEAMSELQNRRIREVYCWKTDVNKVTIFVLTVIVVIVGQDVSYSREISSDAILSR